MTIQTIRKSLALLILGATTASAQEVKRDVKVTGPKGRSIERQIDTVRTPGHVERDIKITRPSGTYERDVSVSRGGRSGGGGFVRGPGGNVFIERDYVVGPPPPRVLFGGGGPSFGLFFGGPLLPPPPVFVAPAPIYVPPPTVVVQPPVRYAAPTQPQTVVADPVAAAIERLNSGHDHSRRDGALALGRLGDARAVPPLIDRVNKDWEKEVRVAAAWALGEIGDPRAAITLQKAALYDKRKEVRDAANIAYKKLGRETIDNAHVQVAPPSANSTASELPAALPSSAGEPPLESPRSLDPPPPPVPVRPSDRPK
jgi:HEAT repeats